MSNVNPTIPTKQSDMLLWLAGALVAGVGVTWLLISSPWSSSGAGDDAPPAPATAPAVPAPGAATGAGTAAASTQPANDAKAGPAAQPPGAQASAAQPAGTSASEAAATAPAATGQAAAQGDAAAADSAAAASSASADGASGAAAQAADAAQTGAGAADSSRTAIEAALDDDPLRMAKLAYQAGMLVEPEQYSAWALYRRVLAQDPGNGEAKVGLQKVADDLLKRANSAVEQGRFDDARKTVDRIREALPNDPGAAELTAKIDKLAPKPAPPAPRPSKAAQSRGAEAAEEPKQAKAEPAPAKPQVDYLAQAHEGFLAAIEDNRLLTPADSSAKHFLGLLASLAPEDKRTQSDRRAFFAKLLARADESLQSSDTEAASTWIDEAEALGVDAKAVAAKRQKLTDQLVKIESARRLPRSEFKVVSYTPPKFPQLALEKGVTGWVDVEFTVARDGTTRDVTITDAKNERYFKDAAIEAVSKWRFEPRVFMNRTIEQRAYTRINFNLDNSHG